MFDLEKTKPHVPFGRISPRTKITSLAQLCKGDHVMEESPLGYWHHFIVEKVKPNFAWVIHKTGDQETGLRSLGESNPTGKAEVIRTKFVLEPGQEVYRVEYPPADNVDGEVEYSAHEVVRRARKRMGERDYNAFTSNCEHFCRECKAGKPESYQAYDVLWTIGRLLLVILQGVFGGVVFIVASATGLIAQTSVLLVGHAVGLLVGLIQDALWIAFVVLMADHARSKGHVTPVDAEKIKAKRVTPIVSGFVGGVGGAALGYYHIPLPVIGSVVGAVTGNFLCQALGLLVGRWVSTFLK
ncbi:hypothetical protein ACROYT_G002825 [Oculina patagonica]